MKPRRVIPRLLLCLALGLITTIAIAETSAARDHTGFDPGPGEILPAPAFAHPTYELLTGRGPCKDRIAWRPAERLPGIDLGDALAASGGDPSPQSPFRPGGRAGNRHGSVPNDAASQFRYVQSAGLFPRWWGRPPAFVSRPDARTYGFAQDARGWPFPALWCEWCEWDSRTGFGPWCSGVNGGVEIGPASTRTFLNTRALPFRPIWRGLAADTMIFALAWSLLLAVSRTIRTRLRLHRSLRRNLCPRCAYSREGLAPDSPCPECGRSPRP